MIMADYRIPFSNRSHLYTDAEIDVVTRLMRNAKSLTQGVHQQTLEKNFSEYLGTNYSFAVCNATAALEIAAQLCCFEDGEEVIVPAHTFTSSAYPFLKHGAKIVWADINLETGVVDAKELEKCISRQTKAIVVPHLYGYGADMVEIVELAKANNMLVIEDVAQAIGVKVAERKVGTFGDIAVFSFHDQKNMTTLGEGGMIVVNNDRFVDVVPMLRHNGHCNFEMERDDYWLPAMGNLAIPMLEGTQIWPNNFCLGEIQCALASELLKRVDHINVEKRKRAINFIDSLSEQSLLRFHRVDSERHNYHLLVAQVSEGKRDQIIRKLAHNYGIQCAVQYYPLYRYPFYQSVGFGDAFCPNTDLFFDNMLSIPFAHSLTDGQIEFVESSIREVVESL
jgi:perosamine synthetase